MKLAVPLLLTAATAVGISLEAPIFVAAIFLFTLAAYARAAVDAWGEKSSINAPISRTFVVGYSEASAFSRTYKRWTRRSLARE
jgi:hypothetical protein